MLMNFFFLTGSLYSISASDMVSQLGLVFGSSPRSSSNSSLVVGEVVVGDVNPLERAVKQSRKNYEKVVLAQETVNGVKVDGIDTNLAVMKVKKQLSNKSSILHFRKNFSNGFSFAGTASSGNGNRELAFVVSVLGGSIEVFRFLSLLHFHYLQVTCLRTFCIRFCLFVTHFSFFFGF